MLDKRVKPVRDVTRGIRAVEKKCEEMVTSAAQLAIDMLAAADACKLPVSAGQEALERVGKLLAAGIEARAISAGAHVALADVAVETNAPVAWGDDCPPDNPAVKTEARREAPLQLVA